MSSPLNASILKCQGETQRALAAYGTTFRKFIEFWMSRGISHPCLVVFSSGIRRLCCTSGAQKQQSQAHRKWTCSTRVTCAYRATELWRGRGFVGGLRQWELLASTFASAPWKRAHLLRGAGQRWPDNFKLCRDPSLFCTPAQWHLMNSLPGTSNRYVTLLGW